MKIKTAALTFLFLLAGCNATASKFRAHTQSEWDAQTPWSYEELVDKYEAQPDDVKPLILQNRIRLGMTQDQCLLAWGYPEKINRSAGRGWTTDQWCYANGKHLYFYDGCDELVAYD